MKEKKYKKEIKEDENEKCDDKTIDYFFLISRTIIIKYWAELCTF